ncbi:MAG: hypothetical protein P4M12_11075 [Gammaproteobacteria bacterium]|nr:hypothetical protein [Gammaproteobacteria bacterium]
MIHDLYIHEAALVDQICLNLSDNLSELFNLRTKRWPHPYMHDECFTLGLFSDLTENISSDRAFILIPIALDIVLKQKDNNLLLISLSLLVELARASKTTELPLALIETKNDLEEKIMSLSDNDELQMYWNSLKEWYRLTVNVPLLKN